MKDIKTLAIILDDKTLAEVIAQVRGIVSCPEAAQVYKNDDIPRILAALECQLEKRQNPVKLKPSDIPTKH